MSQSYDRFSPQDHPSHAQMPNQVQPKKSGCGCWVMGCLGVMLLGFVSTAVMAFLAYRYADSQLQKFTSATPVVLPTVEFDEAELEELESRIENFQQQVNVGQENAEIVLSAEEINALINKNPDTKGRVFIKTDNDVLTCDVSIPLTQVPLARDRFLNGSATLDVRTENGELHIHLLDVIANGEKIPEEIVRELRKENLVDRMKEDKDMKDLLDRVEEMRIENGNIILKLKADFNNALEESSEL